MLSKYSEETTSYWNSVFVMKKKSRKLRMLTDLSIAVEQVIQPMESLQSRIPLPSLLPKDWPIAVIGL